MPKRVCSAVSTGWAAAFFFGFVFTAQAQTPVGTTLPHQGIIVVPRPVQIDSTLITSIAQIGAQESVKFPQGANVAQLIARKCGKASETVLIHPTYWNSLIDRDLTLKNENLTALREERTVILPACAPFALTSNEFDNPRGLDALTKQLGVPFSLDLFRRLVSDRAFKTEIIKKYVELASAAYPGGGPCNAPDVVSYFECVNTIEILYINRDNIVDENTQRGRITLPTVPASPSVARVPIDSYAAQFVKSSLRLPQSDHYRDGQGISNVIPVPIAHFESLTAIQQALGLSAVQLIVRDTSNLIQSTERSPKRVEPPLPANTSPTVTVTGAPATAVTAPIEEDVKFVSAVSDVKKYGRDCYEAHERRAGRWPFDVNAFNRVWALQKLLKNNLEHQNVLVMDTGFDFTWDNNVEPPTPEADYFPRSYFTFNVSDQKDAKRDRDGDKIPGNRDWAGVNLASLTRAGVSAVNDRNRSHGLAVATLVLGGRDLQHIRAISDLPVKIGIGSLTRHGLQNTVLSRDHITNGFAYAVGGENRFSVINLSLYTKGDLPGAANIAEFRGRDIVIVAAAGNDEKELNDDFQAWPADLGGKPTATDLKQSVVISVGGHDASDRRVKFSNYSRTKVDILAPACMIPSFVLRRSGSPPVYADPLRAEKAFVSGTSFAAPVVSFLVALIRSDTEMRSPSAAKERILVGTDFSSTLKNDVYSSGILNVGKVLGHRVDIVETGTRQEPRLRYGKVTNKVELGAMKIKCNDTEYAFSTIKKLAYDPSEDGRLLLMHQSSVTKPWTFERDTCVRKMPADIQLEFFDRETGVTELIPMTSVIDYIPAAFEP